MLVMVGVSVQDGSSVVSVTSAVGEFSTGVSVLSGVVSGTVGEGVSDGVTGGVSVELDQWGRFGQAGARKQVPLINLRNQQNQDQKTCNDRSSHQHHR